MPMVGRRVASNAGGVKVGNIGGFEIRLSWIEGRIRTRYHRSSATECKAAAETTVYSQ